MSTNPRKFENIQVHPGKPVVFLLKSQRNQIIVLSVPMELCPVTMSHRSHIRKCRNTQDNPVSLRKSTDFLNRILMVKSKLSNPENHKIATKHCNMVLFLFLGAQGAFLKTLRFSENPFQDTSQSSLSRKQVADHSKIVLWTYTLQSPFSSFPGS